MNLQSLKYDAKVKLADALGMFLPETVRARLSGLGEPIELGSTSTLASIQHSLRLSERGEVYYLWTLFRDMIRNDSHIQTEFSKRIFSFMGQAETIEPCDKNNPDDVIAAQVIEDMISACDNWTKGSVHLASGHIWPIVGAEKLYQGMQPIPGQKNRYTDAEGKGQFTFRHPVTHRLRKLHPIPYALFTYKIAYYNLNTVTAGANPLGGPVPQANLTMSGIMPVQDTQGAQPLDRNLVGANNNPALIWNPEDWHPDLRFYDTYTGTGMIDWSMATCYKPDPERHVLHSSDVATAGLRENLQGVLQSLLPWWLFSQSGRDWFARFIERYASPFAVAYANTSNKNIFDLLTKAFNQATKTNALIVPPQAKIELKECNASGGADAFAKFIEICNTEKTKALVGQTLSTSSKGSGMMGGSGVADLHGEVREEWSQFDKRTYCEMQGKQIFEPFLRINGYRGRCKSVRGGVSAQQQALISKTILALFQAGKKISEDDDQKLSNLFGFKIESFDPAAALAAARPGTNPASHTV